MVEKYRKLPVVVDVLQFKDHNHQEIESFCGDKVKVCIEDSAWQVGKGIPHDWLEIKTLEGIMRADDGDYIIKGVNGEFYPCKPDIFKKTYEKV